MLSGKGELCELTFADAILDRLVHNAYHAALNLLDAKPLFSSMKIGDLLDPGIHSTKSPIERHHLFPKNYLRSIGIHRSYKTNQIANFAFLEWADNLEISDDAPSSYFPDHFEKLSNADALRRRAAKMYRTCEGAGNF